MQNESKSLTGKNSLGFCEKKTDKLEIRINNNNNINNKLITNYIIQNQKFPLLLPSGRKYF